MLLFFCFEDIREKDDVCLVVLGNNCWLKQELTYDDYNPWEVRPTCMKSTGSDYLSNLLCTRVISSWLRSRRSWLVAFSSLRIIWVWNHVTKEYSFGNILEVSELCFNCWNHWFNDFILVWHVCLKICDPIIPWVSNCSIGHAHWNLVLGVATFQSMPMTHLIFMPPIVFWVRQGPSHLFREWPPP